MVGHRFPLDGFTAPFYRFRLIHIRRGLFVSYRRLIFRDLDYTIYRDKNGQLFSDALGLLSLRLIRFRTHFPISTAINSPKAIAAIQLHCCRVSGTIPSRLRMRWEGKGDHHHQQATDDRPDQGFIFAQRAHAEQWQAHRAVGKDIYHRIDREAGKHQGSDLRPDYYAKGSNGQTGYSAARALPMLITPMSVNPSGARMGSLIDLGFSSMMPSSSGSKPSTMSEGPSQIRWIHRICATASGAGQCSIIAVKMVRHFCKGVG